jgi:YHS domain-containing protein
MKKVLSIVIVVAVVFAVVAFAGGCKSHEWGHHHYGEHGMWMHGQEMQGMPMMKCPRCGAIIHMQPMMMHRMQIGMEGKEMAQTTCPITGKPINKQFFIDHMGKRIYFCSAACIDEFKKNPEKCMAKMKEMGQMCEPAPGATAAPVPGAPAP